MYRNVYYKSRTREMIVTTWDEEGNRITKTFPFNPYYYVETTGTPDAYSIFKTPLKKKVFETSYDRFQSTKDGAIKRLFGNLPIEQQFLIDEYFGQNEQEDFTRFALRVGFIDIETYSPGGFPTPSKAEDAINVITIYDSLIKKFLTWGTKEFFESQPDEVYMYFPTEREMLKNFLDYWSADYFDVISGWNSEFFDIPYIINRIKKVLGDEAAKRLSPYGDIRNRMIVNRFGRPEEKWMIKGISLMDYFEMYRTFTMAKRESYKLGYIAEVELGETKLDYKGKLSDLADKDWNRFVKYNIQDVRLLPKLEAKLQYLMLARMLAYLGLTPMEDALGTVTVVTGAIAIKAREMGYIIPTFTKGDVRDYAGGYVREPVRGLKPAIVSFDANSLYPNTIVTLNLSPETKVARITANDQDGVTILTQTNKEHTIPREKFAQFIKSENLAVSKAGILFSQKEKGICPIIIDKLYSERVSLKAALKTVKMQLVDMPKDHPDYKKLVLQREQLDTKQYTVKILLNRMYGYFQNKFSPMADTDLSSSITLTGQAVIKEAANIGERFIDNKIGSQHKEPVVIYGDTDSVYFTINEALQHLGAKVHVDNKVTPECYAICMEFEKYLNEEITKWAQRSLNTRDSRFAFKRETISDSALFIQKKRYIVRVLDSEGVPCDKIKYVGVNIVSSATPGAVKPLIKDIAKAMLHDKVQTSTDKKCKDAYDKFKEMEVEKIAFPRGITDMDKWAINMKGFTCPKGTPIHVKAAIYHNMLLDYFKIDDRYEKIRSGERIKFYYVKRNPFGVSVIGYKYDLPDEFKKAFKVDTEKMFDKIVSASVEILYAPVNWVYHNPNNQFAANLVDLFS